MSGSGQSVFRGIVPAELSSCNTAGSFLQSGFWGSFKARFGWNARAFLVDWAEGGQKPLMVIRRKLFKGVSFSYVPWGPEFPDGVILNDEQRNRTLVDLAKALRHLLPKDTAFIRFDPPWFSEGAGAKAPEMYAPFRRAGADIQPPDTVLVDLEPPEETILMSMKPKWRYNIRLAEKKGVTVKPFGEEGLETFYRLYKETAKRDGIAIHGLEYYKTLFTHAEAYSGGGQELRLYLAEHEGDVISGVIILFRGKEAVYLYGASADHKRNLMAPYLLQWQAMRDAKSLFCVQYDLFGIPPEEDPEHPMAGLYRFKTGFGGKIIHRPGSWDYTYKPVVTGLFNTAEALRKKIRSIKKVRRSRNFDSKGKEG